MNNIYLDGIMGLVVADALGVPAEFKSREELAESPVKTMTGYGTYNLPAGSWSDDSSMTLATLNSLASGYDAEDIMDRFVRWVEYGKYTPHGKLFDIGIGTRVAIMNYQRNKDIKTCGGTGERDNGNGSLMRILPVCLYCVSEKIPENEAIEMIHEVSGLTHNHIRSKIACGLYYFMAKAIICEQGDLAERLQRGLDNGFSHYNMSDESEVQKYKRIIVLDEFAKIPINYIKSSGYVVDSLEASLWCLITTNSYEECTLKAVNLGEDTDTVSAIAGGLAGLYYGYDSIPKDWLGVIAKREKIKKMCNRMT